MRRLVEWQICIDISEELANIITVDVIVNAVRTSSLAIFSNFHTKLITKFHTHKKY